MARMDYLRIRTRAERVAASSASPMTVRLFRLGFADASETEKCASVSLPRPPRVTRFRSPHDYEANLANEEPVALVKGLTIKSYRLKQFLLVTAAINAAVAGAALAAAGTLRQALVGTYQNNPTLTAQRESLKAIDATVAIARAEGRPSVAATVGVNRDLTQAGVFNRAGRGPFSPAGSI